MRQLLRSSAALGAALLIAACGSTPSMTGASDLPGGGATVRGTVLGGLSATSADVTALSGSSGIRVSVVGTGIATTTNADGEFVLEGLPAGTAVLEFEVGSRHARLEISGLMPGQEIVITVSIAGSDVELVDVEGEEVEVHGTVESLDPFQVSGRVFEVTSETRVERRGHSIPFDEIAVGDVVEVKGVRLPDGSVLARRIQVEEARSDDDHGNDDSGSDDDGGDSDHDSDQDSDSEGGS